MSDPQMLISFRTCDFKSQSPIVGPIAAIIALETLGLWATAPCSLDFLTEMDRRLRRLSAATGDAHETAFLFQRISVAIQWFNAVLIHESFVVPNVEPDL